MPVVNGTLEDIGAAYMTSQNARVILFPDEVSVAGAALIPTKEIYATVGPDGVFSFGNVRASMLSSPATPYNLAIEWTDTAGNCTRTDIPRFKVLVPEDGGRLADMLVQTTPTQIVTLGPPGPPGPPGSTVLPAAAVLAWKPNTSYAKGATVITPKGDPAKAKASHTSGSTFVSGSWEPSTQDKRITALEVNGTPGGGPIVVQGGAGLDAARRPLIGARVGVGSGVNLPDDQYFDELHRLESDMNAVADITNWYRGVGPTSAEEFTATVKPELAAYPNRIVNYCLEGLGNNSQLNKDLSTQTGIYDDLVETLLAIKSSGYADRVVISPMHEGNGGGGSPGSIGAYEWQMFDTTTATFDGTPNVRLNTPAKYKQAFRGVVDLARDLGLPCKIAQWFLAANTSDATLVDGIERMDIGAGYAGDAYVDVIGLSYYNRSMDPRPFYSDTWPEPGANGLREFYNAFERFTKNPLWILESGSAPTNQYGNQSKWYADLVKLAASDQLPRLEGVVMFMQDSRRYTDGVHTAGLNMKLDSALDSGGTSADVLAAKQVLGRAINAARRTGQTRAIPQLNRNMLPPAVSDLITTDGWDTTAGVTLAVGKQYRPDRDGMANGMRITKPAYVTGDDKTSHYACRKIDTEHIDYVPNEPYVLQFSARAQYDGFRVEAGMRQGIDTATTIGDELVLSNVEAQYVVPFSSVTADLGSWREPNFNFGNNKNASSTWFEIWDVRLARGTEAQPDVERLFRPTKRELTGNDTTSEIFWNCQSANIYTVTLTRNYTLRAPTGAPYDGQELTLRVVQDGTGGRSLNLHSAFYSSTSTVPLTTLPGAKNILKFQYDADAARWGLLYAAQWGLT